MVSRCWPGTSTQLCPCGEPAGTDSMKSITLLLTANVEPLGIVGEVVTVRPGYARNFLLPRRLATEPTEANIKRLADLHQKVEQQMQEKRLVLEQMLEKLADYEITILRSANEQGVLFGGVSGDDIAEALRGAGFEIDSRGVRIGEPLKRLDTYSIPITLAADLKTEIKLWVLSDKPNVDPAVEAEPESAAIDEVESASENPPSAVT